MRLGHLLLGATAPTASALTLTYHQNATDTVDRSTYTFSGQAIGAASATRRVVAAVFWRGTATSVTSVTIGGVTASADATGVLAGSAHGAAVYSAVVPSGTTADVVVALPATASRAGIALYTVRGATSAATDTSAADSVSAYYGILSVDVSAGGVVIAASHFYKSTAQTCSWTGVTEHDEFNIELAGLKQSVAGGEFASGQTVDPTGTWTDLGNIAAAAVAYAPALPPTLEYLTTASEEADQTSYTFASQALGAEASDRVIVVAISQRSASTRYVSAVTIGGVSATLAKRAKDTTNDNGAAIWYAQVPTGTSGDVVCTSASGLTLSRIAIALYRVTGGTPSVYGSAESTSGASLDVGTQSGDVVIGAGYCNAFTDNVTTWSGLTKDVTHHQFTFASALATATESPRAVSASFSNSLNQQLVTASIRLTP